MQPASDHCARELAYEKSLRQTDIIYDEERARQLRLQILLLEDENDSLHDQLAQNDDRIDELEGLNNEFKESLDAARNSLETVQSEIRLKSREIETLKIELGSLHEVTMDSTKLLTEKLALARELSSLKPEVDHLRSQAASQQTTLSEKLSLQRQLGAVQEELELEKRSTERAMTKEKKSQVEEAKAGKQLEALQAEINKERTERQKAERQTQKQAVESESKTTTLEARLDAFRTKLKTTKDQLKETQAELQAARAAPSRSMSNNTAKNAAKDVRKRPASLMEDDTMIGTPGDLQAAKRGKRASALPGDKSTFSITPFLTRTASVAPEDVAETSESEEDVEAGKPAVTVAVQSPSAQCRADKARKTTAKSNAPERAKPNKVTAKPPPARKPRAAPALEQVAEEVNDDEVALATTEITIAAAENTVGDTTLNLEAKKKKRKLLGGGLGKTLFDDDDGEAVKGARAAATGGRSLGALGRVNLGGPKTTARFGGSSSGFGAFSPLKKDRKASAA